MRYFQGKNILITGGSMGLGIELVKYFITKGSNIAVCARNKKKLSSAIKKISKTRLKNQKIFLYKADVSKEEDINKMYKNVSKKWKSLDILISNAGVYGPKGSFEKVSWSEWKKAFNVNFFGSVYVIKKFIKLLKKSKNAKIIQLSGGGATSPLPNLSSYASSKVAIVRFSETVSKEISKYNIDYNCIAPGALNTRMLDEILKAGPKKVGKDYYKKSLIQKKNGGAGFENAIKLISFLSSKESKNITGKLISAQWDNWNKLKKNLKKIQNSDVFTIRRIVGRERKLKNLDK